MLLCRHRRCGCCYLFLLLLSLHLLILLPPPPPLLLCLLLIFCLLLLILLILPRTLSSSFFFHPLTIKMATRATKVWFEFSRILRMIILTKWINYFAVCFYYPRAPLQAFLVSMPLSTVVIKSYSCLICMTAIYRSD